MSEKINLPHWRHVLGGCLPFMLAAFLLSCDKEDLGKACGTETDGLPAEAIGNENPLAEVVRLERDGICESFQCLTHRGLPPYCTRECRFDKRSDAPSCDIDDDCTAPALCAEGKCLRDDCPSGFECTDIQEVGPLANRRFCVLKSDCSTNFDCEDLGKVECRRFGCAHSCDMSGADPCDRGQLQCLPFEELGCACPDGDTECPDDELICQPQGDTRTLPEAAVTRQNYCVPIDP